MPTPGLIARLVQDTSLDQAHDALARLDTARARLSSRSILWRLMPPPSSRTVASRTENMRLSRRQWAVIDATVLSGGFDMLNAVTVSVPLLDGRTLRVQHRGRTPSKEHPALPRRTSDAIHSVLDHAETALRTAILPEAEDGFEAVRARFDGMGHHSVLLPTRWNPERMICSCGSNEHPVSPIALPHALDVWVKDHHPFSVVEIRTEAVELPLAIDGPIARLRAHAALARSRSKDAA